MQINICLLFFLSRETDAFPESRSNRHARTIPLREASIASLCYIHPLPSWACDCACALPVHSTLATDRKCRFPGRPCSGICCYVRPLSYA
ncbi:uncharacterized protein LY79DRAFT_249266 [Colletotrichum navitas]|uniref:Secreted protein n=1 Tax=Colletotrichum navitas TaxID=681940 RepID=A0AAD8VA11_9PEZI|nr:uncharacterized protein LY79DRAFT_249266 [Colletotrichum navitas]KAK1598594.1 hypothetical protein LY79DRAFT_249266 [Colletotrichum navitas]